MSEERIGVGWPTVILLFLFGMFLGSFIGETVSESHSKKIGHQGETCYRNQTCDANLIPVVLDGDCRCSDAAKVRVNGSVPGK